MPIFYSLPMSERNKLLCGKNFIVTSRRNVVPIKWRLLSNTTKEGGVRFLFPYVVKINFRKVVKTTCHFHKAGTQRSQLAGTFEPRNISSTGPIGTASRFTV